MVFALLIYENSSDFARRDRTVEKDGYVGAWRKYYRAMVEAGIDPGRVLAAPGASGNKDTELQYAKEALAAGLCRVKKFVLATDNDDAGRGLREALAQCLGVARCWFVDLPEGVKDVNDFLRSDGPRALHELV